MALEHDDPSQDQVSSIGSQDALFAGADPIEDDQDFLVEPRGANSDPEPYVAPEPEPEPEAAEPEAEAPEAPELEAELEADAAEAEAETAEGETEEADSEEADSEPEKPQGIQIPKARLDHEVRKRRAAEQELEELRGQAAKDPAQEPPALIKDEKFQEQWQKSIDMSLDGKVEEAAQLQMELMSQLQSNVTSQTNDQTAAAVREEVRRDTEQRALDIVAERLLEQHDFLNPEAEVFDEFLSDSVIALRDGYINKGYSPAEALDTAAATIVRAHHPEQAAGTPAPAAPEKKVVEPIKPDMSAKAKAAQSQAPAAPAPSSPDAGDSPISFADMTEEDFDRLTDAELSRMRGDARVG